MNNRLHATLLTAAAAILLGVASASLAANAVLGDIELRATNKVERNAGVWIDGQYMGYLRELKGRNRLILLPGEHDLLVKLIGYQDMHDTLIVEPGQTREYTVTLAADPSAAYPEEVQTAKLRISVEPESAAVFVNDVYAGHVDRFNGRKGARLRAGTYRFKIAMPGYQAFETELTLRANQDYEIKTELLPGSIAGQTEGLRVRRSGE
jgi:hypothetical protein